MDLSGKVEVTSASVVVTIDKRAHNPYLVASGLADQPTPMPWFGGMAAKGWSPSRVTFSAVRAACGMMAVAVLSVPRHPIVAGWLQKPPLRRLHGAGRKDVDIQQAS